ncbi:flagellar hook-length control protein FliK [Bosea sp. PAMC 26642]|uniref:flagellar hook-length control protein FliK n=1 Tax=Bosea sp. (strain PAMC 26642) TaxID=1792307 RepID=UPI0007701CBC|nr:flagellar hook-length control protein FliK [Bosea sp. PAMC 26642]AMJ60681.1 hypothetical protein AXW83_10615 [Bosea sp. PAMC 26642]
MNIATLVQSQTLATLLQALAPATGLVAGKTIAAQLVSIDGDGTATALVEGIPVSLKLAGPEARQAALQPGATLTLRLDPPETPGAALRATLIETRPPPDPSLSAMPRAPALAPPVAPAAAAAALPADTVIVSPATSALAAGTGPATGLAQQRPEVAPQLQPRQAAIASPDIAQPGVVASPRALAGPLIGSALAHQDSLAPLFANMRGLASGSVALTLPRPLLALIGQVLAQAIPVERKPLTAQVLREAVAKSGLFHEAVEAGVQRPTPQGDLKAGLLALRDVLEPLIGAHARPDAAQAADEVPLPANPEATHLRPAPPRRDGTLTPQPIVEPSLSAGDRPLVIAQTLLDQTEAAIDRLTLGQYASLPPDGTRADAQQGQRWLTELPLAFQAGTAILPLQIEREPPRRDAPAGEPPLWRLRFALDVEPLGPLQGIVTLQGRSVGVTLWAEREGTSQQLRAATPGLETALVDAQFEPGTFDIHTGHPRVMQPTAGQFLDRLS